VSPRRFWATREGYDRDSQVVATKVFGEMDPDNPNARAASPAKRSNRNSRRVSTGWGWTPSTSTRPTGGDYDTPVEETLRALDDAVRRGTVRYIGTSSMWAHQFADALNTSDALGLERFATMQNHYNVLYREEEREMLPLCESEGHRRHPVVAAAGPRRRDPPPRSDRFDDPRPDRQVPRADVPPPGGGGEEINERIQELADEKGVSMAQISLAWLLHKDWVDAPIVGTTSVEHLEDAVEALEIDLSESEMESLEEPYEPLPVAGHE